MQELNNDIKGQECRPSGTGDSGAVSMTGSMVESSMTVRHSVVVPSQNALIRALHSTKLLMFIAARSALIILPY